MSEFEFAGKLSQFEEGDVYGCALPGIAVVNIAGKLCAFDDFCTHEAVSLTGGYGAVYDDKIICMLHSSVFKAETGEVLSGPAYDPLKTYEIKVEGEDVFISRT